MEETENGSGPPVKDRLVATDGVLVSEVDDEQVLLDTDAGTYYGLNAVGTVLWDALQEPRSVEELVALTAEEFDVSSAECRDDVRSFVTDLDEAGLVEPA
jgi:outer membrane protein assembly factor BamB